MSLVRNPVAQLLAAGALALALVVLGTGRLSERAAEEQAVSQSIATTEVLARSVAQPAIPAGLVAGRAGAIDRLDRTVLERLLVGDVLRIKIWTADGVIVYSDRTELIGDRYALGADEREVLAGAATDAEVSDVSRPENRYERGLGGVVEVYTGIRSPEGEPLLFEAYYSAADVSSRTATVLSAFRPITLGGLGLMLALATPLVWALTRRLTAAAAERERLLRAAVEASDAERRRIARDLHDTVVQDLAGTSFALAASAQEVADDPDLAERLDASSRALRGSLRGLRSLLVEIYPPDLHAAGLAAALDDLVAPAASAGVRATVTVEDLAGVPDDTVGLVWRVAQEAVRNALRHARPDTLDVRVETGPSQVVLAVEDDGCGFDPARAPDGGHFGLRGLRELIREAGGRIDVRSAPGRGTTVRLEVART